MCRGCRQKSYECTSLFYCRYDKFLESSNIPLDTIQKSLNEDQLPQAVMSASLGIDSIEKCLWILRKKFNHATTSRLRLSEFQSLKLSLKALVDIKFPMLISVQSSQALYKHVVVVWRKKSLILNVCTHIH